MRSSDFRMSKPAKASQARKFLMLFWNLVISLNATTESIYAHLMCEGQEEKGTHRNKSHFFHKQDKGTQPSRQVHAAASTQGSLIAARFSGKKCLDYKYI